MPYLFRAPALWLALAAFIPTLAVAADTGADDGPAADPQAYIEALKPQHGDIQLPNGIATLKLNDAFAYLPPDSARKLIEDAWGNPPGTAAHTLGMLIPTAHNPLERDGWGVVISYSEEGHVADSDADTIDYGKLLKDMQAGVKERNEARQKQGYPPVELIGWAEPPHFDKDSHKLYWARELAFNDSPKHSLNYAIRVLGRKGVLELNAVADMSRIDDIREDMKQVVAFTDFSDGNRYGDFISGTDKVAAYGIAALIAGGVAAKVGLFAKLGVLLLAFKKFIFIGLAAMAAALSRLFKRRKA